jgi:hypothetical protein
MKLLVLFLPVFSTLCSQNLSVYVRRLRRQTKRHANAKEQVELQLCSSGARTEDWTTDD